ncbi:DUF6481 family protein [Azorhizobium sp. AG788]|uniref:DUF6481 family protein n=1 Tax=Azorhizobium sp. AG788 TaxID=2183897 RepID=UPI00313929E7
MNALGSIHLNKTWNVGLADRLKASASTKKSRLESYRSATAEPELAAKLAERVAIASAREERNAERVRLKAEEQAAAEAKAVQQALEIEAEARREADERAAADRQRIARVIEDQAASKAERDRRYAERKTRTS